MQIYFNNEPTKITKPDLIEAIKFYSPLLFTPAQDAQISLDIDFSRMHKRHDMLAFCEQLDDWDFEICFDYKLPKKTCIEFLAHEMVHMRQYVRREMIDWNPKYTMWMGKKIKLDRNKYFEYPWEIDAYGRQYGLYRKYTETYGK
jgi:hypothetical protein